MNSSVSPSLPSKVISIFPRFLRSESAILEINTKVPLIEFNNILKELHLQNWTTAKVVLVRTAGNAEVLGQLSNVSVFLAIKKRHARLVSKNN